MSQFRHALITTYGERAVGDETDNRLVNCVVELEQTDNQSTDAWVTKRPGLKAYDDLSVATTDTGRGIYVWDGRVYCVIGDELFEDEVDRGQILTTAGRISWDIADMVLDTTDEGAEEVNGPFLVFHDGTAYYAIDDEGVTYSYGSVASVEVDNEAIPSVILPGIAVLDQYLFLASNGLTSGSTNVNEIHNSNVGVLSEWSGDFIVGELRADKGVAISRYYNYLISFNEQTTEFFYDAANAVGTPLSRFDGVLELIGTPTGAGHCVAACDSKMIWVAQSPTQGRFVGMFDGSFQPKRISTAAIDEYLEAEDSNISNSYAYHLRIAGNNLYVLTLVTTAAKTFVYDLDVGLWYEWTSTDSGETYFTGMATGEKNGKILMLDEDNGRVYELDPETFQDNTGSAQNIAVEIHTKRFDSNNQLNKFVHRLYPVCDFTTATNALSISWSDDDYTTFVTNRSLNLTQASDFLTRCGFYRRRSWRLQHTSNERLRIMALDGDESHGYYGR